MIRNRLSICATLACVAPLATLGCLTREETIRIARDGAVTITVSYEGSPEELETADALPSKSSGWDTVTVAKKDGDEDKHVLTAERTFAPGEELPRGYGSDTDPNADLYLGFPTTLHIEERADGTYYYFRRVYPPRRWAYVQFWEDFFFDDHIKKIGDKPVEELDQGDRLQIIQAFIGVEAFKQLEFAKLALAESDPDLPAEHALIARQALLDSYKEELEVSMSENEYFGRIPDAIDACERLPQDEQGECFDEEAERILAQGYVAFVQSLREDAGFNAREIAMFEQAYDRAERCFEITDELGGHHFEIEVEIPGTVIAHNGERMDDHEATGVVEWTFDGKAFRDRPYELLVVSRLGHNDLGTESVDAVDDSGE